ncbi:MAG: phosphatidylserine decarboxylase, partial [Lachnospiraceae bacterium]|nr:phosphatidylserine decarboxylase [Lachnospiraceae bacterium]
AIHMSEFEPREYSSYNDFFTRKLAKGARSVEEEQGIFVSPCDSRLSVCRISQNHVFSVKNTPYTVESLLKSKKLAQAYEGGYVWVFRLCVDDYHRYIYVDSGTVGRTVRIPGVFHTVNPAANDQFPIYKENTREYCLLRSDNFGAVIQMEVGAMLVGKIENHPAGGTVKRGQEKGNFAFGGSTVILMTRKGAVRPDRDILRNSAKGIETKVRLGERVGIREHAKTDIQKS